jgi:hypothetical protein
LNQTEPVSSCMQALRNGIVRKRWLLKTHPGFRNECHWQHRSPLSVRPHSQLGNGAANRIRTCDPVITNDVLYQLSYCGGPCGLRSATR